MLFNNLLIFLVQSLQAIGFNYKREMYEIISLRFSFPYLFNLMRIIYKATIAMIEISVND